MDKAAAKRRVEAEEDFIVYPKMGNSVARLLTRYPDGVEDSVIMKCLLMDETEFRIRFEEAVRALREDMGVRPR